MVKKTPKKPTRTVSRAVPPSNRRKSDPSPAAVARKAPATEPIQKGRAFRPVSRPAPGADAPAAAFNAVKHDHEHDYSGLLAGVRASFLRHAPGPFFTTDARGLFEAYLLSMPSERQVHNCHCCRRFIETYGGLVTIDDQGTTHPVMWDGLAEPSFYQAVFTNMSYRVAQAKVTGVFLSAERHVWGVPITGKWSHLAVSIPVSGVKPFEHPLLTAEQAMAAKREDFGNVRRALAECDKGNLEIAIAMCQGEVLARSEKFLGPLKWLLDLKEAPAFQRRDANLTWLAVATAPEGYCHPRASVIWPLLEDINAGKPMATVKANFQRMLDPLRYQRPQAAPKAGNIDRGEAIIAAMGLTRSLERRYALEVEVPKMWESGDGPQNTRPEPSTSVFGHLRAPATRPGVAALPAVTMTWAHFQRTQLPSASKIELHVPKIGRFIALTTATHPDAPPILKWDYPRHRNRVGWYVWPKGSWATQWGLTADSYVDVTSITPFPNLWGGDEQSQHAEGVVLILAGARDTGNPGAALFPEHLRNELHEVRTTIEAYSKTAKLAGGHARRLASGYDLRKDAATCTLRVWSGNSVRQVQIDRWE